MSSRISTYNAYSLLSSLLRRKRYLNDIAILKMEACCTCARLLSAVPAYSEKSEKLLSPDRQVECCRRVICGDCLHKNSRFETYCPYCQISSEPSLLPQGLKEPPSYDRVARTSNAPPIDSKDEEGAEILELPPPYTSIPQPNSSSPSSPPEYSTPSSSSPASDPKSTPTLHHLHPDDTIPSLALSYSIPPSLLRSYNRLNSDHLLAARKTILIPPGYSSVSLSPHPVESEEEATRKTMIRRWMVATKIADYEVACLYLENNRWDLDRAVEAVLEDEKWERKHPVKGKGKERGLGMWASQAAFLKRRGT